MAKKRIIKVTLAGYTFSLKNLEVHEDISDETTCFSAELVCNGKAIAFCRNDGRGGDTEVHNFPGKHDGKLCSEALHAIKTIRDTEYEKEYEAYLKQQKWYDPSLVTEQYWTPDHLADQLMCKQHELNLQIAEEEKKGFKVKVLLGAEAVYAFKHEGMTVQEAAEQYDGEIRTHTFKTKAERDAYLKGFNEATGCPETAVLEK